MTEQEIEDAFYDEAQRRGWSAPGPLTAWNAAFEYMAKQPDPALKLLQEVADEAELELANRLLQQARKLIAEVDAQCFFQRPDWYPGSDLRSKLGKFIIDTGETK